MNIWQKFSIQNNFNKKSGGYSAAVLFLAAVFLVSMLLAGLCIGPVPVTIAELRDFILGREIQSKSYQIIAFVRIPRILGGLLAGAALSASGAVLQNLLNNALASPNIIGVNAGAGCFTIALAALLPAQIAFTPFAAFLGALFAAVFVYLIAKKTGSSRITIILSGVAVSSILSALTDTFLTLFPDTQVNRTAFLIGGLSGLSMKNITLAGICICVSVIAVLFLSYDMNVLALGEESARSLGLRTGILRSALLILSALLAGSAVSFAGLLGFVGLIIPHIGRFLIGHDNRLLLPLCLLLGGGFVLGCDLLARTLVAPYELPVGIVMSFLGGPFFIWLLCRKRRGSAI